MYARPSFRIFVKLLLLLPCLLMAAFTGSAQLQKAEYFFNTDPGYGAGIPLYFTTASFDTTFTFSAGISGLAGGLHQLCLRTFDQTKAVWGPTAIRIFYKEVAASPALFPHIAAAEYFIDTDPGPGAGVPISITEGQDISFSFDAALTGIPDGFHKLYVRVRDAQGNYSLRQPHIFLKYATPAPTAPQIVKAEYYIDTDPGLGAATPVPVTAGQDIVFSFAAVINSLPDGLHRLVLRCKDEKGVWSNAAMQCFFKSAVPVNPAAPIVAAEYFLNLDPGLGHGTGIPLTEGLDLTFSFNPFIGALAKDNFHHLFVRVLDTAGNWSLTAAQVFFIPDLPPMLNTPLSRLEYFIDTDPGPGAATSIPFTPGLDVTLNFTAALSELSAGIHRLALRARDANGLWSLTASQLFYREPITAYSSSQIVKAEYFINSDPGLGLATPVAIVPGQDITFAFSSMLSGLPSGMQQLYVRTKDAAGNWSVSAPQLFYYEPVNTLPAADIVQMEYFLDTDPGQGNATAISLAAGQAVTISFTELIADLPPGMHRLLVRSLDAAGNWSVTASQLFYKDNLQAMVQDSLQQLEWFWDNDPGFGMAQAIAIPKGKTVLQHFSFNVPVPASFSNQIHYLYVRAGLDWGHTAVKVVDFSGIALPVTLLHFGARSEGRQVLLDWRVAKEQNMSRYVVERSTDGQTFQAIGSRQAIANGMQGADYQLYDSAPVIGFNYYRLRQEELDGQVKYAPVNRILFGGAAMDLKVFPNPATGYFSLTGDASVEELLLLDMTGKTLRRYGQSKQYSLEGVPAGTYLIQVLCRDNNKFIKTIVVK